MSNNLCVRLPQTKAANINNSLRQFLFLSIEMNFATLLGQQLSRMMKSLQVPCKQGKLDKKRVEAISKFTYYCQFLIPALFKQTHLFNTGKNKNTQSQAFLRSKSNETKEVLYYNSFVNNFPILEIEKGKGYLPHQEYINILSEIYRDGHMLSRQNSPNNFTRLHKVKASYVPQSLASGIASEDIQIVITKNSELQLEMQRQVRSQINTRQKISRNSIDPSMLSECSLYVLHTPLDLDRQNKGYYQLHWDFFVEKYQIKEKSINYCMICSISKRLSSNSTGFLSSWNPIQLSSNTVRGSMFYALLKDICSKEKVFHTLQSISQHKYKKSSSLSESRLMNSKIDSRYTADIHRRILNLPPENYKDYEQLKREISLTQFGRRPSENDLCRYLVANNMNVQSAKEAMVDYYQCIDRLKKKYKSIEDFPEFNRMDIFRSIGEDRDGRPLILIQAYNIDMRKYDDIDRYADYCVYMLEIHFLKLHKGIVDSFNIIEDCLNLQISKAKISFVVKSIAMSLKYSPERLERIAIVNANTATYYLYRLARPFIPKKTDQKISLFGVSPEQIRDLLLKTIDIDAIPKHLGGRAYFKNQAAQDQDE